MTPKLRCIAIDDEPLALKVLQQYIAKSPSLELLHTFNDAISGAEYLRNTTIDLLFIDINMPDINGIDLVRTLVNKPMIIFTTAYKKFAYDGFELNAVDYLLKPIDYPRFLKSTAKALSFHQQKNNTINNITEFLFVRSEYQLVKIDINAIDHIEALEDYIRIHLADNKPVLTLMTLKAVTEKLSADKFIRIHRSYIVPTAKIKAVLNRKVLLASGKELPVSDSYIDQVNTWAKGLR